MGVDGGGRGRQRWRVGEAADAAPHEDVKQNVEGRDDGGSGGGEVETSAAAAAAALAMTMKVVVFVRGWWSPLGFARRQCFLS